MRMLLRFLLVLLSVNYHFTATQHEEVDTIEKAEAAGRMAETEILLEGNKSQPFYDKTAFDHIKETLKVGRGLGDVVLAVINTSTVLRCRLDKNFSYTDGQNGIKFIWRRLEKPIYLTFNYQRISQDKRYHVVMADFTEFKMDLRIERVTPSDEGGYVCLYRDGKLVHRKNWQNPINKLPNLTSNKRTVLSNLVHAASIIHKSQWLIEYPSRCPRGTNPKIDMQRIWCTCSDNQVVHEHDRWKGAANNHCQGSASTLIISNVTRDLRGVFTCVAYNGIEGKVSRNIHLDVYFRPVVKMSAEIIYRKPYQSTMIFATVVGNPIHSLYWEFDHKPIRSVNGDCFFTLSGDKYCVISDREIANPMTVRTKLTIYNLTLDDYGTYTCVVHSPFGMERGSTELVREKEKRLDYPKPDEAKFFPNLWNPSSWRNSQGEYASRPAPKAATSGERKKFPSFFLHIFIGINVCLSPPL